MRWLFAVALLLIAPLAAGAWLRYALGPTSNASQARYFEIKPGTGVAQVAEELERAGLVRDAHVFRWYVRWRGEDRSIKAGLYALSPRLGVSGVVGVLVEGQDLGQRVIVPEGWTISKLAERLDSQMPGVGDEFLRLVAQPENWRADFSWLPVLPPGSTLEGFLFPDTYVVTPGPAAAESLVRLMLSRFEQVALPELNATGAPLGVYQRLIMASIIEKEAVHPRERPTISGVFYNRLALRMPFGSDPTVEYALGRHQGERGLSYKDVAIDSPYNTYKYPGLPPTPIANPGLASLRAAVLPERTDKLYFVAQGDGSHVFTRSYREHLAAQARILASRRTP